MRKILLISDPMEKFNILGDSTYLLTLTAGDMGFQISQCLPEDVYSINNQAFANINNIRLAHGLSAIHSQAGWFEKIASAEQVNLSDFEIILVRNDPPFTLEYYYLTQILELAHAQGVKVINSPQILRNFNEKLSILNFPQHIVPTLVSKNKPVLKKFIREQEICIAKPIDMMGGRGVFKTGGEDPNQDAILESLTNYYTTSIMVQRFIPEVVAGDKRIFVINGEVIDYCLCRIPQSGQIRGNLAVGGRGEVQPLNEHDYLIARDVAVWLKQQQIAIAGLDVIGNYLTEVNLTSPTGAQQIYRESGINVFERLLIGL